VRELRELVRAVGARHVPDARSAIFDVRLVRRGDDVAFIGETTVAAAAAELMARAQAVAPDRRILDQIMRLPDPALGDRVHGLARASIVPVHARPHITSTQVTQYILGHRLDLLARRGPWWRVRGEDGYIGWVHEGYIESGAAAWAEAWERGEGGEPMVSLGAELVDEEGRLILKLPWGARLIRDEPRRFRLPDGRQGMLGDGELVEVDRLADRFPARGESVARTARRWIGTPYLWGGVSLAGADCSGFVQSVFWLHGIALPRDSDQQARIGSELPIPDAANEFRSGDLLFFSERPDRITHVAISLGGSEFIHSALSNGGVGINDLAGETEADRRFRSILTCARRLLPD